jgi:hypothetical protein
MVLQYKLTISKSEFKNNVQEALKKKISRQTGAIQASLNENIDNIVLNRLISAVPTIQGDEYYQLGVPDINERIQSIIRVVAANSTVVVTAGSGKSFFTINIGVLNGDYSDLLSLPEAVFQDENKRGLTVILPWLEWLLLNGTQPVVDKSFYDNKPQYARVPGGGFMINNGFWSVPASIAGTSEDNFLTRALRSIEDDIILLAQKQIRGLVK